MTDNTKKPTVHEISGTITGSGIIVEPVEGWYRKKPVVLYARRMTEAFVVSTWEGTVSGKAGDWLVQDPEDPSHRWPVANDVFERYYEPA